MKPRLATKAVMRTGRRRVREPLSTASSSGVPALCIWMIYVRSTMPFRTAIPNRAMKLLGRQIDLLLQAGLLLGGGEAFAQLPSRIGEPLAHAGKRGPRPPSFIGDHKVSLQLVEGLRLEQA